MKQILEQLRRPKMILLVAVVLVLLLYERAGPKEVIFYHAVPACGSRLVATAFLGREKMRSSTHHIERASTIEHAFLLPKGEYLLRLELECKDGELHQEERTLMLENDGSLDFDFSRKCSPCN
jgi:hypothetical protein